MGETRDDGTKPFEDWYQAIRQLEFPTSTMIRSSSGDLLQSVGGKVQRKAMAYLLLMDLRRQQLEWNLAHHRITAASLRWIYLLQRPDDFSRLTERYFGNALSPEETKTAMLVLDNRSYRNRSYKKSKP